MNWRDLKAIWPLPVAMLALLIVGFAAIVGSYRPDAATEQLPARLASPKWEPTLPPAPAVEPPAPEPTPDDPGDQKPDVPEIRDETPGDQPGSYPCECTPTCPCDAEHCQCRGKSRCSEVCPCHKKLATFHCPKCDRNGYCDYDPSIPEQSHPHRVCRDCKQWMDRVEPPMSAQEGYDVIVWRRVQAKMQADAKAREQAAKAEAERRKQRSSMPVYDPFDEDMPSWRPRRFYFNSTSLPAAGCKT
ncbi:MAG TPA: hypothetical protein VFW87_23455 [Pirellulales bacterium]|nr:hypothetical protein [Pirellulales bacterium]